MKNPKLFYSVIIGLIVIFAGMVFYTAHKKKAEDQKILDYFNSNREEIVSSIEKLIDSEKYQDAFDEIDKYSTLIESEVLVKLKKKTEWEQDSSKREKRTKEIIAALNQEMHHLGGYSWYASHRKELEDLHEELVKLNPGNEKFIGMQKKFLKEKKDQEEITNSKIESAKKQQEERIASFGEPPDPSRWGLHGYEGPVMEYLKQRAHNPPSVSIIGCSKPGYTSDGWILFCEYRGQNAFGAMIHTTKAFTIVNGKVTKMEDPIVYGQ